jgi:hypothetical protein
MAPFAGLWGVFKPPGEGLCSPLPIFAADGVSKSALRFPEAPLLPFDCRELGVVGFSPSSLQIVSFGCQSQWEFFW